MVERWHPTSDSVLLIAPHPRGDYVHHTDYAALEAKLAERVKAKQLEWVVDISIPSRQQWRAGDYGILKTEWSKDLTVYDAARGRWLVAGPFADLEAAKAAAQADFERRTLSGLEATPPAQVTEDATIVVTELKMTPISEGLPTRDELRGEQTILTYTDRVGTWDVDFMEAGWGDYDAGFSLGVTHWLDITGMWPGVIAQVASFHDAPLTAEQEQPAQVTEADLKQDVIDLVIAAREFWDDHNDLSEESGALDKALVPFADRVPYDNEPEALTAAQAEIEP